MNTKQFGNRRRDIPCIRFNRRNGASRLLWSRRFCVAVAIGALSSVLGESGPRPQAPAEDFAGLVHQYRFGDPDAAVRALVLWPASRVNDLAKVAVAANGERQVLALGEQAAVVMLHTEAALRGGLGPHLVFAKRSVARLSDQSESVLFLRSWRILVASWMLAVGRIDEADDLSRGADSAPESLLLQGAVAEGLAQRAAVALHPLFADGQRARRSNASALLGEAAAKYRAALVSGSALPEAELRLGRVLALLNEPDAALELLAKTRKKVDGGFLGYLAALFEGDLQERAGRREAAREAYEAALREYPGAQAAAIALAHLLQASGETNAASRLVSDAFAGPRPRENDPWWVYSHAQFWQADRRLEELRAFVRQHP